jgi:2-polyprenyl-3-methyl-5-hydroxy-6-metoxy-1,4-benzoquinol methylase
MTVHDSYMFKIQDSLYEFPYHYIPHFTSDGTPFLSRKLNWGLEYLCYQQHLREKVLSLNPGSVLEVGCGDGCFVGNLPPDIPVRVGADLSSKAIAFARAFHPDCTFYDYDAAFIEDRFDVVVAIEVMEHIPEENLPDFFNVLYKRLNDNGRIIISVPTTVIPLNKKHYRHYTKVLFKNQLQQSGVDLQSLETEYVFSKPWWYEVFLRFSNNRFFNLEIKPVMRVLWQNIWRNHRTAKENTGFHLVVVLGKGKNKRS